MKLSGVVLTKNEKDNIKDCLNSISFCDEIIVIDDVSRDKTVDIAKKIGAKVFIKEMKDDFAGQRNYALNRCKGKWLLFVDADERVSSSLRDEITKISKDRENTIMGYYLKREDYLWGKLLKHGEASNIKLVRFARRSSGKWQRKVHETWKIVGKVQTLKNPLIHHPHPAIGDFIDNINYFSTLHAKENLREGKKSSLGKIIFWPIFKFLNSYILHLGFLDGTQGFMANIMMSFHSYLSWSKLWIMQKDMLFQKN